MPSGPVLEQLLTSARAQGAVVVRPVIGASLGPTPDVPWLTALAVKADPAEDLDVLFHWCGGEPRPYAATCQWMAHHEPTTGDAWVLLEAVLRTRDEYTILVSFDNLGLHGQVLRDTIRVDWVILLDADDPDAVHALARADFDALEAARHIALPNPDTQPLRRLWARDRRTGTDARLMGAGEPWADLATNGPLATADDARLVPARQLLRLRTGGAWTGRASRRPS